MSKKRFWRRSSQRSFWNYLFDHFEHMSFGQVLLVWILVIIIFGMMYAFVNGSGSLLTMRDGSPTGGILDSIYFSFITATSTGFGDIVPLGIHRLFALVEVIIGLTLFALVTSKLVGIKQEHILKEIYEISLQEKIHRIRSSLYLYRADLSKIIAKIEEGSFRKREVAELWTFANFFEQRILEIVELFSRRHKNKSNSIDMINTKLLANSMVHSLNKTEELLRILELHKVDWRREVTRFAFTEACKASSHALKTMRHEQESGTIKHDIELFEKKYHEIKKILKS